MTTYSDSIENSNSNLIDSKLTFQKEFDMDKIMEEGAKLANLAISLEKEERWEEAYYAYSEVCTFFKNLIKNVDSRDFQDLLYLYRRYTKQVQILKAKFTIPVVNTTLPNTYNRANLGKEALGYTSNNSSKSEINNNFIYDDIHTVILNDSVDSTPVQTPPLVSTRRPSVFNSTSDSYFKSSFMKSPLKEKSLLKKSSMPSISSTYNEQITIKGPNRALYGGVVSWDETASKNNMNMSERDFNNTNRFYYEPSIPSPKQDRFENRQPLDLMAIPELEESFQNSGNGSHSSSAHENVRTQPMLRSHPSLPNIKTPPNPSKELPPLPSKPPISNDYGPFPYITYDSVISPNWRDSMTTNTNTLLDESVYSNNSSPISSSPSSQYIFATVQPRIITNRKPSVDYFSMDNPPTHITNKLGMGPNRSLPSLVNADKDFTPKHSSNINSTISSISNALHLTKNSYKMQKGVGIASQSAQPAPMLRSNTAPTIPLMLYTNTAFITPDLFNEATSPKNQSEFPVPSLTKYNVSLLQTIWNEEESEKEPWNPPPTATAVKPLWRLVSLSRTMTLGGYFGSKKLYIVPAIWKQAGVRLTNLDAKLAAMDELTSILTKLNDHWMEDVLGISDGLTELETIAASVQHNLATKLDFIPAIKKVQPNATATAAILSFANKITKSVEKIQFSYHKDKLIDVGDYLHHVITFVGACSHLEDWYTHFSEHNHQNEINRAIATKLLRFFEFLNSVILAFLLRDLDTLLSKYLKRLRDIATE